MWFQEGFKRVSRKFQGCFMEVSRMFQGSFKDVSRKFQSFKVEREREVYLTVIGCMHRLAVITQLYMQ